MRRCSKCRAEYADGSRICRSCGGILDEVEELPETTAFEPSLQTTAAFESIAPADSPDERPTEPWLPDDVPPIAAQADGHWTCPTCGERVPATFDVCWNCDAETQRATDESAVKAPKPAPHPPAYPRRQCPACGSDRMIPGASLVETQTNAVGTLAVIVDANPHALVFKNRLRGVLLADVCGDCGRVELRVSNGAELYEHYLRSLE